MCVGPPVTSIVMASELALAVMTFSAVFMKLTAGNILRTPNRTVLGLHTHTHACTRTHTHTHTYAHAHTHTHAQHTHTHTRMHTGSLADNL